MLRVDKEALRDARDRAAQEYLCGSRDLFWLMAQGEERKGHKYQIAKREKDFVPLGVDGFRVPLITWTGVENGERVFFPGREHGVLWSIARFGDQGLDAQQFRSVLSSFRWLHEDFFQSVRGQ